MNAIEVRLHAVLWRSAANGPGRRAVVWFQGCDLGCRGCFNPATHAADAGTAHDVTALADKIVARAGDLDGLTVSGGEPFQQPAALRALCQRVRRRSALSIIVFSGYRRAEIEAMPDGRAVLSAIDLLIAGRYVPARHHGQGLLGSSNQDLHLLGNRLRLADLGAVPDAEITIDRMGAVTVSGIAPVALPPALANRPL